LLNSNFTKKKILVINILKKNKSFVFLIHNAQIHTFIHTKKSIIHKKLQLGLSLLIFFMLIFTLIQQLFYEKKQISHIKRYYKTDPNHIITKTLITSFRSTRIHFGSSRSSFKILSSYFVLIYFNWLQVYS